MSNYDETDESFKNNLSDSKVENENSEEDDDFLPEIPELMLQTSNNEIITSTLPFSELKAQKRPRSPNNNNNNENENKYIDTKSEETEVLSKKIKEKEENISNISLLNSEGYPSASLYERSYHHGTQISDIGIIQDDMGALIITIDISGILRAWRKLPRGVFFMGEHHSLFPIIDNNNNNKENIKRFTKYYILIDEVGSSVFIIRTISWMEIIADIVRVAVEIRRINSTLITVEGRNSFDFSVSIHKEEMNNNNNNNNNSSSLEEIITRRPFLLHHEYQSLIAFFTREEGNSSGVILTSCLAEKTLRSNNININNSMLSSIKLSTANPIICCQQHKPSGLVVLVDEKGIIDYAKIISRPGEEVGKNIFSLQVIPGIPSRGSKDIMSLCNWISFERRQKTGFFTLLRESINLLNVGISMIPMSIAFSSSGNYFVVASINIGENYTFVCFHIFNFKTGAFICRGETDKIDAKFSSDKNNYLNALLRSIRGGIFDIILEEVIRNVSRKNFGGFWIFIPEINLNFKNENQFSGRRIFVFRATPKIILESSEEVKNFKNIATTTFDVQQIERSIGDVEKNIREINIQKKEFNKNVLFNENNFISFFIPLKLIRLSVPATQALKNIISQSPVGCALSQEDVKKLFIIPSTATLANLGNDRFFSLVDSTFFTSSLGGESLLLYTKYEAPLDDITLNKEDNKNLNEMDTDALKKWQIRRDQILLELHHKRNFNCDDLQKLQSSLQCIVSREAMEEEEEEDEEKEKLKIKNSESEEVISHINLNNSNDKLKIEIEEQRVQNIFLSSLSSQLSLSELNSLKWGKCPIRASILIKDFGNIIISLLPHIAPKAVTNFIGLARRNFYNGLTFHRIISNFMIQGGCPVGDGTGGVSYFDSPFEDEGLNINFFSCSNINWVCLANHGPNTNSSQFFITLGKELNWLNGKHTVFGFVSAGRGALINISNTPRGEEDRPMTPVIIENVMIVEEKSEE